MKKLNPYQHLLKAIQAFYWEVTSLPRKEMWNYPKADLGKHWDLLAVWERTAAARQLGYETILEAREGGLHVLYRKVPPNAPVEFKL